MLEKPDLQEHRLVTCLQNEFAVDVAQLTFLPLGADQNTAVYRVVAGDETSYFLKLRSGNFDETSVALPKYLSDQGIEQIIAPLTTRTGRLRATLDAFKVILYPFVNGRNGYEVAMSARNWHEFGSALKRIHSVELPLALIRTIRRETYSPQWREIVKMFLKRVEDEAYDDPVAQKAAALLKAEREQILDLVSQSERLAQRLQTRAPDLVLCHSDVHAGNILIDAESAFYIVIGMIRSWHPKSVT